MIQYALKLEDPKCDHYLKHGHGKGFVCGRTAKYNVHGKDYCTHHVPLEAIAKANQSTYSTYDTINEF